MEPWNPSHRISWGCLLCPVGAGRFICADMRSQKRRIRMEIIFFSKGTSVWWLPLTSCNLRYNWLDKCSPTVWWVSRARCFWRRPSLVWKLFTWFPWQATPDITAEGGVFPHEETICPRNKITKSRKTFLLLLFLCTYLWLFSDFSILWCQEASQMLCFSYRGYIVMSSHMIKEYVHYTEWMNTDDLLPRGNLSQRTGHSLAIHYISSR